MAFIGAGSIFTPLALYTISTSEVLSKAEIYLIDINEEKVEVY